VGACQAAAARPEYLGARLFPEDGLRRVLPEARREGAPGLRLEVAGLNQRHRVPSAVTARQRAICRVSVRLPSFAIVSSLRSLGLGGPSSGCGLAFDAIIQCGPGRAHFRSL
jgi:hypothetical protein